MRYFEYRYLFASEGEHFSARRLERLISTKLKSMPYQDFNRDHMLIFPIEAEKSDDMVFRLMVISDGRVDVSSSAAAYASHLFPEITRISEKELYASDAIENLETAIGNGFFENDSKLFSEMGLHAPEDIDTRHLELSEAFVHPLAEAEIRRRAEELTAVPELAAEVDRILKNRTDRFVGNPAQYIIATESKTLTSKVEKILFAALNEAGRLGASRLTTIQSENISARSNSDLKDYLTYQHGSIVVYVLDESKPDIITFPPRDSDEELDALLSLVRDNAFDMLSVIEINSVSANLLAAVENSLDHIPYIILSEEKVPKEGAEVMLRSRALSDFPDIEDAHLPSLCDDKLAYTSREIEESYRHWHSEYLCQTVFPEYSFVLQSAISEKSRKGRSASARLDELVGLADAKNTIREMVDYCTYQKQAASRGINVKNIARHMVFTGNPGTAKTTVARLAAEILKDNKVLKYGDLIEVGRADIVDRYVGGTAPRVKRLFSRAKGNVLFIDEAYSLVDDRAGLFGDEAINTIVQEMENHRDDVIVIFAGYPDKMETFLQRNPGLRSRISFHVKFEDYSPEELFSILELITKEDGFVLADDVEEEVMNIFSRITSQLDFGNGRFVRNLYEKAKLNSVRRFLKNPDAEQILHAEDFEMPVLCTHEEKSIGFQF